MSDTSLKGEAITSSTQGSPMPKARFVHFLQTIAKPANLLTVLECGSGSGTEAELLAHQTRWEVWQADLRAHYKPERKRLVLDVTRQCPLRLRHRFNLVYCCALIHLFSEEEKRLFFRFTQNALKENGTFVCLTASVRELFDRQIVRFFPTALQADLSRYLSVDKLEFLLRSEGFKAIARYKILLYTLSLEEEFFYYKSRTCSLLRGMPDDIFEAGLKQIQSELITQQTRKRDIWRTALVCHK